ncbi:MAG: hypothetical protein ACYC21_05655 [Eubacteriales bacterium]
MNNLLKPVIGVGSATPIILSPGIENAGDYISLIDGLIIQGGGFKGNFLS